MVGRERIENRQRDCTMAGGQKAALTGYCHCGWHAGHGPCKHPGHTLVASHGVVAEGRDDEGLLRDEHTQGIIQAVQLLPIQAPCGVHPWGFHHASQDHSSSKLLDDGRRLDSDLRDLIWRKSRDVAMN